MYLFKTISKNVQFQARSLSSSPNQTFNFILVLLNMFAKDGKIWAIVSNSKRRHLLVRVEDIAVSGFF